MAVTNVAELVLVRACKKSPAWICQFHSRASRQNLPRRRSGCCRCSNPTRENGVAESGMGIVEYKVIKNHFASEYIYNAYKDEKTWNCSVWRRHFGTIISLNPSVLFAASFRPLTRLQLLSSNHWSAWRPVTPLSSPRTRVQKMQPTKRLISFWAAIAAGARKIWSAGSINLLLSCLTLADAPPRHQPDPRDWWSGHG